jgi:hypothetical protein
VAEDQRLIGGEKMIKLYDLAKIYTAAAGTTSPLALGAAVSWRWKQLRVTAADQLQILHRHMTPE